MYIKSRRPTLSRILQAERHAPCSSVMHLAIQKRTRNEKIRRFEPKTDYIQNSSHETMLDNNNLTLKIQSLASVHSFIDIEY